MNTSSAKLMALQAALSVYLYTTIHLWLYSHAFLMQPDDMPDAEDFDEQDLGEEGLTELDRSRHVSKEDELDLIEDEDDSFVDELDEEE